MNRIMCVFARARARAHVCENRERTESGERRSVLCACVRACVDESPSLCALHPSLPPYDASSKRRTTTRQRTGEESLGRSPSKESFLLSPSDLLLFIFILVWSCLNPAGLPNPLAHRGHQRILRFARPKKKVWKTEGTARVSRAATRATGWPRLDLAAWRAAT